MSIFQLDPMDLPFMAYKWTHLMEGEGALVKQTPTRLRAIDYLTPFVIVLVDAFT